MHNRYIVNTNEKTINKIFNSHNSSNSYFCTLYNVHFSWFQSTQSPQLHVLSRPASEKQNSNFKNILQLTMKETISIKDKY